MLPLYINASELPPSLFSRQQTSRDTSRLNRNTHTLTVHLCVWAASPSPVTPQDFSLSLMSALICYISIWPPLPPKKLPFKRITAFTFPPLLQRTFPSPEAEESHKKPSLYISPRPPMVGCCTAPLFHMFQQNSWENWCFVGCFQEQSACCIIHHSSSLLCQRRPPLHSWYWGDGWGNSKLSVLTYTRWAGIPALYTTSSHLQRDLKWEDKQYTSKNFAKSYQQRGVGKKTTTFNCLS